MNKNFAKGCTIAALALALLPATVSRAVSQDKAAGRAAYISAYSGQVQRRGADDQKWETVASVPFNLSSDDSVRTAAASQATVVFNDDSRVELGAGCVFVVAKQTVLRFGGNLDSGGLMGYIEKLAGRQFFIQTPTALAAVRGTQFKVDVLADGRTSVKTIKGRVTVEDRQGNKKDLNRGEQIEADKNGLGKVAAIPNAATPAEMEAGARKIAEQLTKAYESKNRSAFLQLLSDGYRGDAGALSDALSRDFKNFSALSLDLHLEQPEIKGGQITFDAFFDLLNTNASGAKSSFRSDSKVTFRWDAGEALLLQITGPLVFGREPAADMDAGARAALASLIEAYSQRRRSAFMKLVSDDFLGNLSTLEDALTSDFRTYQSVNLDAVVIKSSVNDDRISLAFTYNMAVVDTLGASTKYSGSAEYLFKWENGKAKLVKMSPVLFGNTLSASQNPLGISQGTQQNTATAPGAANAPHGSVWFGQNSNTTGGGGNFTVPAGVTSITVKIWGAGGGGGANGGSGGGGAANGAAAGQAGGTGGAGGGGGGGGYTTAVLSVTPGQVIAYVWGAGGIKGPCCGSTGNGGVGAGGTAGGNGAAGSGGGTSSFGSLTAGGGAGGGGGFGGTAGSFGGGGTAAAGANGAGGGAGAGSTENGAVGSSAGGGNAGGYSVGGGAGGGHVSTAQIDGHGPGGGGGGETPPAGGAGGVPVGGNGQNGNGGLAGGTGASGGIYVSW